MPTIIIDRDPTVEELQIIKKMGDGAHGHGDEPGRPEYYRVPLQSRDAIVRWLLSNKHWNDRVYNHTHWRFCFDVKLYSIDLSFDHLLTKYLESYADNDHPLRTSQAYLEDCRKRFEGRYGKDNSSLYDIAVEDARDGVIEPVKVNGKWTYRTTDTYNTLWVGESINAELSFNGRSDGWLVVNRFNGLTLDADLDLTDPDQVDYETMRQLYEYITMLSHDFGPGKPQAEVEFQAAYHVFERLCDDIPTVESMLGNGI